MFDKSSNYKFSKVSRRHFDDHPRHYAFRAKFKTGGVRENATPMETTIYIPGNSFSEARERAVERLYEMERRGYTQEGAVLWAKPRKDFGGRVFSFGVDIIARIGRFILRH